MTQPTIKDGAIADDITAGSIAGNLIFADNEHIYLGTGNDLDIFHNGSNSVVKNITGALFFESAASTIAAFTQDAAKLYFQSSQKLETVTGGVNITGALDVSGNISGNGSLVTNVDAATLGGQPVGTGPLDIVALDASSRLPAVDGSQLTNLPASGPIVHAGRITGAGTVHAGTDAWTVSNVNAGRYTLTHGLGHTNYSIITGMANVASITGPRTTMTDIKLTNAVDIYINDAATGAQLNDDVEYTLIEW